MSIAIVILSAGKGKRMLNPTMAKVMSLLGGKPLIGHVLEQVKPLAPEKILVIVGHQKDNVIDYVSSLNFSNLSFVEQMEQLGTGHAVAQTEQELSEYENDVLILSGDVPLLSSATILKFIESHYENDSDLSVLTTETENPTGYGRIVRDSAGVFKKIVEEKDATDNEKLVKEINSGVYLVRSQLLFSALKNVKNNNASGEYYLTDIIEILKNTGAIVNAFLLAEFEELQGINSPEDLLRAETFFKSNK
ncbi:MAG: sugar phosphate nucleotidyltransferase [Bacteroidota bacterium]|jgi:UDP-N-acetylglucosamine diphosphorylase/glucosamine-1-phosphate N-acetyltransferase